MACFPGPNAHVARSIGRCCLPPRPLQAARIRSSYPHCCCAAAAATGSRGGRDTRWPAATTMRRWITCCMARTRRIGEGLAAWVGQAPAAAAAVAEVAAVDMTTSAVAVARSWKHQDGRRLHLDQEALAGRHPLPPPLQRHRHRRRHHRCRHQACAAACPRRPARRSTTASPATCARRSRCRAPCVPNGATWGTRW